MHSFHDLEISTLKKICSKYNLHMKIAKYSKLSKAELIPHMEKHLMINQYGKIQIKPIVERGLTTELTKMIEELKSKVKEVKEKVQKQKAMPKEEEKNINIEKKEPVPMKEKKVMKAMTVKQVKEEAKKYEIQVTKKINGKVKPKTKKELLDEISKCKEKAMMKEEPKKEEKKEMPKEERKEMMKKKKLEKEELANASKAYADAINKKVGKEEEKERPMSKIDKIENELMKLEQMIKMDEKQNEKEHKKLHEEIKNFVIEPFTGTLEQMKQQYKKQALKFHPDKNMGNEKKAKEAFNQLTKMYEMAINKDTYEDTRNGSKEDEEDKLDLLQKIYKNEKTKNLIAVALDMTKAHIKHLYKAFIRNEEIMSFIQLKEYVEKLKQMKAKEAEKKAKDPNYVPRRERRERPTKN